MAPARARRSSTARTGKTQKRKRRRTATASRLYSAAKKHGEAMQQPSHASAKPDVATGTPGRRWKIADGEVSTCFHCSL